MDREPRGQGQGCGLCSVASIWLSLEPMSFAIQVLVFFFSAESQITEQVVSGSHLNVD